LPTLLELADPAERPALVERLSRRLTGGEAEDRYQAGIINKSGERIETDVAVRLLKTGHGPRIIAVVRDVTEDRRREAENRELEEMKSDFVSMVAHDLRSPAAVIVGLAQTLHDQWGSLDEEQRRLLVARIATRGKALSRVASQAVEVARLDRGKPLTLQVEDFDIAEVIDRVLSDVLGDEANTVEVVIPADLPFVSGDRQSTWHVISNLLSNAVKFSPEGGRVEISANAGDDAVTITVKDDGPGIPEAERSMIFEKFYAGRRSAGGGTGLGLYIARGLVEAQQGKLWLDTEAESGALFHFSLPAASSGA
jgi:signal transduction histidine kinase